MLAFVGSVLHSNLNCFQLSNNAGLPVGAYVWGEFIMHSYASDSYGMCYGAGPPGLSIALLVSVQFVC
jgi:hypothetical protein